MGGKRILGGTRARGARRLGAGLLAVALGAGIFAGVTTGPAEALSSFEFSRDLAGTNRYDTARQIARQTFGSSKTVLLASGTNFPDALAASYLAGHLDVPILLTDPVALPHETQLALESLGAENVVIIGGPNSVSTSIESGLRAAKLGVDRISGATRYATALSIAKRPLNVGSVGTLNGERVALLANGGGFADALAAGPLSFAEGFPLLLTPSNQLGPDAAQGLKDLQIQRVIVLGGLNSVNQAVEDAIRDKSINVTRIAGADRTETATALAEFAIDTPAIGFSRTHVNLARGDEGGGGVDALTGATHAGREHAPILLAASPTQLDMASLANTEFLFSHADRLFNGHIFGGAASITEETRLTASYAAGKTPPPAPSGQSTPSVFLINLSENYFVSTAGRTYYYGDQNDTYRLRSTGPNGGFITIQDFEAVLNTGDIITANYNSTPGAPSSFNITDDRIEAPGKPVVQVSGGRVQIRSQESDLRSIGTVYQLQRAAYASLLLPCSGSLGAFVNVGPNSTDTPRSIEGVDDDYDGIFTDHPGNGCFVYRVMAHVPSVANSSRAFSDPTGNVTVPQGNADDVRPRILDLRLVDAGTAGTADTGDEHVFTFSERMDPSISANGAGYQLSDGDGTVANVVCGVNATCTRNDVLDGSLLSPQVLYSTLTVKLTGSPTRVGGSGTLQYPATIVNASASFRDPAGNTVNPANSDITLP